MSAVEVVTLTERAAVKIRDLLAEEPEGEASVLRMVFTGGMRHAAIGLVLGLAAAFGVTRVLAQQAINPEAQVHFSYLHSEPSR